MVSDKKEIVYNNIDRFAVIVATGEYKGVKYVCVNRGKHPCAYVMCSQEFLDKHVNEWDSIDGIYVHGGVSFVGQANELLGLEDYDSPCFGWDYGHAGDWAGYISENENLAYGHRKYTTEMIVDDCQDAIDQYLNILKEDQEKPDDNSSLTKEYLGKVGFTPVLDGIDDALQMSGGEVGKKWKIYIDLQHPNQSYALNQSPRRKYEGEITTFCDLKSIIQLFDIPITLE